MFDVTPEVLDLWFHVDSSFSSAIYVRPLDCAEPGPAELCGAETVYATAPVPGRYYVVVDGLGAGGTYTLYVGGTLALGSTCGLGTYAYFNCERNAPCLDGVCTLSACVDGIDNDGDGHVDFDDPGCSSNDDLTETDPAIMPACSNGIDDDGDGLIDYPQDPQCEGAGDDVEQACGHDLCVIGTTLAPACSSCVAQICANDAVCCKTAWDSACVMEVAYVCGLLTCL